MSIDGERRGKNKPRVLFIFIFITIQWHKRSEYNNVCTSFMVRTSNMVRTLLSDRNSVSGSRSKKPEKQQLN